MDGFIKYLFAVVLHLGAFGLIIVGALDSSFLIMPLGNDLLVVAMTARAHSAWKMLVYAACATAGSVLGCFLLDVVARKGGEAELGKFVPEKRLEYVKKKIKDRAGWTLGFAAIMPPPFPFTPFVAGAAALEYPRRNLLSVVGVMRFVRFSVEGVLAIYFGPHILQLAEAPAVKWSIIVLIVIAVGASAYSIYHWFTMSKSRSKSPAVTRR